MSQSAIAISPAIPMFRPAPAALPDIGDTIAAVTAAGRLIAELQTQLEAAKRTIAALQIDKRALENEIRGLRAPLMPPRSTAVVEPPSTGSRLDDALAAIAKGLGPSLVRMA